MKIGCLQFAPHVGDVHNNLNRADAVLNKGVDLEELDLLVLPELAFTGYNFRSLAEISPCLEPAGSGISALWARTIALKYGCHVVVGYPEKVDVAHKWPTSPEFYNSALIVSKDGDTIANYRKSFLYTVDEKWALEGQDGFFEGDIEGLGNVAMGICMDINPYKFEAPWHAFEFAFHILEVEANLVIITMAWLTREDPSTFSSLPQEPDLNTLEYWVQRLEPVIRTGHSEEIIVVFCNRTGSEGDAHYAGTSAVIGIQNGEVNLYGVLGRGVKELLVVDTNRKPFAKLVRVSDSKVPGTSDSVGQSADEHQARAGHNPDIAHGGSSSGQHSPPSGGSKTAPADGSDRTRDWAQDVHRANATSMASSRPAVSKISLPDLTLQIPESMVSPSLNNRRSHPDSARQGTPLSALSGVDDIPTPTAPSPTPLSVRPKLPFPEPAPQLPAASEAMAPARGVNTKVGKIKRVDTPMTPPHMAGSRTRPSVPTPVVETPPSPPSDDAFGPVRPAPGVSPALAGGGMGRQASRRHGTNHVARDTPPRRADPVLEQAAYTPVRPPSTKSRNASNTRRTESVDPVHHLGRSRSRSQMAVPLMGTPGLFDYDDGLQQQQQQQQPAWRAESPPIFFHPAGWTPQPDHMRNGPETPAQGARLDRRSKVLAGAAAEDIPSRQPSRPVSRGRQPFAKRNATNGMASSQQWSNMAAGRAMESQDPGPGPGPGPAPSGHRAVQSADRSGMPVSGPARRQTSSAVSRSSSANWLFGTASPMRTQPPMDPDDEIIAVINMVGESCPLHNTAASQSGSVPPPQLGQGQSQGQGRRRHSQQPQRQQQQHQQQRQASAQRPGPVTVRHRSASGAPRQPSSGAAHSASVPPEAAPTAAATQDGIYELILPPHIRELVEAMTSPEPRDPFLAHGLERRLGTGTPKTFNPPTPTAMQFPASRP